jgi:hypothetical protein
MHGTDRRYEIKSTTLREHDEEQAAQKASNELALKTFDTAGIEVEQASQIELARTLRDLADKLDPPRKLRAV